MSYDLLATFYDAFIDSAVYNEYLRLLDKYTSRGSLLDIGCGTGSLSLKLAKQGFNVTATDLSEEMLSIVSYRAKEDEVDLNVAIYDMLDPIPLRFDTVIASMDVLNHLADLEDVEFGFTNIHEALNPNGIFIFDVLSADYIDMLDGYIEDDPRYQIHWESHKGKERHSIVHTVQMKIDGEIKEVKIYEQTYEFKHYENVARKIGFTIIEKIPLPERMIYVMQKNE
ncbi:MAG: class I SAM-dependent DNA methyltransferase [Candidatus Izemoplasmatales bacterium]|jgi:cyclopropane fatty-acyl-phospholipid synthase-like methyltransferase